jgi:PPOX class probable F420-dependent enzyme
MSSATALEAFLAEPRNVIVAGIRKDGRPHLSPNWFHWDGEHFYVSTTRKRAKYTIFRRDPRAELVVDDSTGRRYVEIPTTVEIHEDLAADVPLFRAIGEKYGREAPAEDELLIKRLVEEDRVLLVFTPSTPPAEWKIWGLG